MDAAKQDNLDPQTRDLVRFAAAVAQGYEPELRERVGPLRSSQVPAQWVEELLLQSVLMVGYPRALIAFGVWRKFSGVPAPQTDEGQDYSQVGEWTRRGEEVCATVYGENYRKLRDSVRVLHPAIDAWMISEGYGRTLGRPGLDLMRRELCTVAQTAVLEAPKQLHSHLRGALNAGASFGQIDGRAVDRQPAPLVRSVEEGQGALAHGARGVVAGELMFIDRAVVRVAGRHGRLGSQLVRPVQVQAQGRARRRRRRPRRQRVRPGRRQPRHTARLPLPHRLEGGTGRAREGEDQDRRVHRRRLPAGPAGHRRAGRRHRRAPRRGAARGRHPPGRARRPRRPRQRPVRHADAPGAARVGAGRGGAGAADRAGAQAHRRRRPGRRAQRRQEHAALRALGGATQDRGLSLHHARAESRRRRRCPATGRS